MNKMKVDVNGREVYGYDGDDYNTLEGASRAAWEPEGPTTFDIAIGCLQRIAAALEKLSFQHGEMIDYMAGQADRQTMAQEYMASQLDALVEAVRDKP